MRAHRVGAALVAAALAAGHAAAQVPLTARSLGMGNAYLGVALGQEALFLNPANIALPGNPHWSFSIPTFTAGATALGLSLGQVNSFRDFGELDQGERDQILADIPASGTELRADVRVPLVALQIRRFALGVSYAFQGNHTLDRDIVDLLVNGYQPGRVYSIRNTGGLAASYMDFAAAYARRVGPVALGVTGHYYRGGTLGRMGVVAVDTIRPPAQPDVHVTYAGVHAEGGSGFGVDVGAAMRPAPGVTLSGSLSNVFNSFEWDADLRQKSVTLTSQDYESGSVESVLTRFDESERAFDAATAVDSVRRLAADLERDTGPPSVLRLGAAWEPRPSMVVAAAYQGNVANSRIGGMWDQSLGVGWQQRFSFVSLRAGVATDLEDGGLLSGGITLGPLNLGLARVHDGDVDGRPRTGWVATASLSARSNSVMP
ncbi:MAG TPA: hypothetical protein VEW03_00010 [Longimicrobiaceae bacterium]|nr:hypothetical protein [Longimicrobiaceae bacterium]